ncbi:MAG: YbjN domain-containing protein [Pseudomonadota bacterium]
MSIELLDGQTTIANPLDVIESVASALEAEGDRVEDAELHLSLRGMWRDTGLWLTWRPEIATLQLGAPLDIRAGSGRRLAVAELITLINERLWVGHFEMWSDDLSIIYRNGLVLPESGALDASQAKRLVSGATEAIDRFFPAFNYVIWGGKDADEAMEASLFETAGTA